MKVYRFLVVTMAAFLGATILCQSPVSADSLKERNELLFDQIQRTHGVSGQQMDSIRTIFRESGYIGQGNPAVTEHPMTPQT